jgi:hypothetical protein
MLLITEKYKGFKKSNKTYNKNRLCNYRKRYLLLGKVKIYNPAKMHTVYY